MTHLIEMMGIFFELCPISVVRIHITHNFT